MVWITISDWGFANHILSSMYLQPIFSILNMIKFSLSWYKFIGINLWRHDASDIDFRSWSKNFSCLLSSSILVKSWTIKSKMSSLLVWGISSDFISSPDNVLRVGCMISGDVIFEWSSSSPCAFVGANL